MSEYSFSHKKNQYKSSTICEVSIVCECPSKSEENLWSFKKAKKIHKMTGSNDAVHWNLRFYSTARIDFDTIFLVWNMSAIMLWFIVYDVLPLVWLSRVTLITMNNINSGNRSNTWCPIHDYDQRIDEHSDDITHAQWQVLVPCEFTVCTKYWFSASIHT